MRGRVEQHVDERGRYSEENRPSAIGREVGAALEARNVQSTAPAEEDEHVRGRDGTKDALVADGTRET